MTELCDGPVSVRLVDRERECPDCGYLIECWQDPEGVWESCDCAAGYVW